MALKMWHVPQTPYVRLLALPNSGLGETVVFNFDSHGGNWPMAWTTSRGDQLLTLFDW